jgi:hypothetical protein
MDNQDSTNQQHTPDPPPPHPALALAKALLDAIRVDPQVAERAIAKAEGRPYVKPKVNNDKFN